MAVAIQRSGEDTKAYQPHAASRLKIARLSTHNRSRSFYSILIALLGKAYHLHDL